MRCRPLVRPSSTAPLDEATAFLIAAVETVPLLVKPPEGSSFALKVRRNSKARFGCLTLSLQTGD
jgi:hypothetical protein